MTHCHQTKFRWTENLTCRFIQLRKENGKLFTGRKYSAQAGWEFILQQMRQEFPTIMADVHYRVLKKKWSNLLQQYKELRNPVHGDRNKADDVSWPFYGALDEVLGTEMQRSNPADEYIDPHQFLCVSVTPEETATPVTTSDSVPANEEEAKGQPSSSITRRRSPYATNEDRSIGIERIPRVGGVTSGQMKSHGRKKRDHRKDSSLPRLPGGTELSIERIAPKCSSRYVEMKFQGDDGPVDATRNGVESRSGNENEERPKKLRKSYESIRGEEDRAARIDRRLEQFFEYTRRRDEENRSIMMRVLHALEIIANKL